MQFRAALIEATFVVLDSADTTVGRALLLLRVRRAAWIVLRDRERYFVFSAKDIAAQLQRAKPSALLAQALRLDREEPSAVLRSSAARVQLARRAVSGTIASRAVILRKRRNGDLGVSAIGTLVPDAKPAVVDKNRIAGAEREPGRPTASPGRSRSGSPAKKAAAKRAPAKKAAKKSADGGVFDRPRRGVDTLRGIDRPTRGIWFGFGGPGPSARRESKPKTSGVTNYFEVIDVFYATDRESKQSDGPYSRLRYLNRLAEKDDLDYGICNVTIPAGHELGKIESPSIWSFEIHEDPKKHFTISGCSTRPASAFFKEFGASVVQGDAKSCFVFIHGYNVSFDDAAKRTAQLAKDLKFLGTPVLYSWASAADWRRYPKDVETVELTIDHLSEFLTRIVESSEAKQIHLIGHSMGNRALVKAVRQMKLKTAEKPFKQIVLTAPDVPRAKVEPLIQAATQKAERVTLYASSKDKALGLSKVKNDYERLGKVYGYPFVFDGMDSIDASKVKTDFWAHTVFAKTRSVLGDLAALIADGRPPDKRFGLKRVSSSNGVSWTILP
jgi:esterase/lipase superfamily enzyme